MTWIQNRSSGTTWWGQVRSSSTPPTPSTTTKNHQRKSQADLLSTLYGFRVCSSQILRLLRSHEVVWGCFRLLRSTYVKRRLKINLFYLVSFRQTKICCRWKIERFMLASSSNQSNAIQSENRHYSKLLGRFKSTNLLLVNEHDVLSNI